MNMELHDVVFYHRYTGSSPQKFDCFFVAAKQIRFVHLPERVDMKKHSGETRQTADQASRTPFRTPNTPHLISDSDFAFFFKLISWIFSHLHLHFRKHVGCKWRSFFKLKIRQRRSCNTTMYGEHPESPAIAQESVLFGDKLWLGFLPGN